MISSKLLLNAQNINSLNSIAWQILLFLKSLLSLGVVIDTLNINYSAILSKYGEYNSVHFINLMFMVKLFSYTIKPFLVYKNDLDNLNLEALRKAISNNIIILLACIVYCIFFKISFLHFLLPGSLVFLHGSIKIISNILLFKNIFSLKYFFVAMVLEYALMQIVNSLIYYIWPVCAFLYISYTLNCLRYMNISNVFHFSIKVFFTKLCFCIESLLDPTLFYQDEYIPYKSIIIYLGKMYAGLKKQYLFTLYAKYSIFKTIISVTIQYLLLILYIGLYKKVDIFNLLSFVSFLGGAGYVCFRGLIIRGEIPEKVFFYYNIFLVFSVGSSFLILKRYINVVLASSCAWLISYFILLTFTILIIKVMKKKKEEIE